MGTCHMSAAYTYVYIHTYTHSHSLQNYKEQRFQDNGKGSKDKLSNLYPIIL